MKKIFFSIFVFSIAFVSTINAQTLTPIAEIQGDSFKSPMLGKTVKTQGIVTAVRRNSFYIQTSDDKIDDNPKTSEAILVYIGGSDGVPSKVKVGNLIEVTGRVDEFRKKDERYAFYKTEIVRPEIKLVSKDNSLPEPVTLTTVDIRPNIPVQQDQMERFEGMRVKIDELLVVAPTGGFFDKKKGKVKSDGNFYGVIGNTPRPFREKGLDGLKVLFDKLPRTLPVFDTNAEMFLVDSDGIGDLEPVDVTAGAKIKNLVAIVDYDSFKAKRYVLFPDPTTKFTVEGNKTYVKSSPAGEREITVASFNLENFFDDEKNSDLSRKEQMSSKEEFERRLKKTSLAIRDVVSMPDILGIIEIENLKVLQKLAKRINEDAVSAKQENPKYEAFLEESNDLRGIDVGFLVKTTKVKVLKSQHIGKDLKHEHKDAHPKETLFSRPPYLIEVEVPDEKTGESFEFTTVVNHFKSFRGIEKDRVQNKKKLQAEFLAKYVQDRQKKNPTEPIILIGDFNAFQFTDGYTDQIGILKGKPAKNVIKPSEEIYQTGLINLVDYISPSSRYSYIFGGSAQVLDHVLINKPAQSRAIKFGYVRLNADFPKVYANDENRPERVSDHDVPILYLSRDDKKKVEKKEEETN